MRFNKLKRLGLVGLTSILLSSVSYAAPIQVVSIIEDFGAIAKEIGGQHVRVSTLVKGSRDLHGIYPKPSMVMAVKKADLLLRLGLGQDNWIDELIQVSRNPLVLHGKPGHMDSSDGIKILETPDGALDKRMGDVHGDGNPHYWLNPLNGKIIARQIRDRLRMLDPDHAADYEANYNQFAAKIDQKMIEWTTEAQSLQDDAIVTYHKVWAYFAEAFGLSLTGELEPLPGIPPSTSHLLAVSAKLDKQSSDKLLLMASYFPTRVGKSFATTSGSRFVQVPTNVGPSGIDSYTELFDHIIEEMKK